MPAEQLDQQFFAPAALEGVTDINELDKVPDRSVGLFTFLSADDRIEKTEKFIADHFRENVLLRAVARVNRPDVDSEGVQKQVGLVGSGSMGIAGPGAGCGHSCRGDATQVCRALSGDRYRRGRRAEGFASADRRDSSPAASSRLRLKTSAFAGLSAGAAVAPSLAGS